MDKQEKDNMIPSNNDGVQTDTSYSENYNSLEEAKARYQVARQKLLNISNWHEYAGSGTADFQLTDKDGESVARPAREGDHFRINIPGPGLKSGDGFDWVQIEAITENSQEATGESIAIKVRPAPNPKDEKPETAHFFSEGASSTFIVKRENLSVSAEVHGRNEKPNTQAETILDKARNLAVATGALLGLSKLQWKSLTKGLIAE